MYFTSAAHLPNYYVPRYQTNTANTATIYVQQGAKFFPYVVIYHTPWLILKGGAKRHLEIYIMYIVGWKSSVYVCIKTPGRLNMPLIDALT